jgi:hypothetical protein
MANLHPALGSAMTAILSPAVASAALPPAPIQLMAKPERGGVSLIVFGTSTTACKANYRLEVSSGAPGSNRSVQSGTAHLRPDAPVTLIKLSLAGRPAMSWFARLTVMPCDGPRYEQVKNSGDVQSK